MPLLPSARCPKTTSHHNSYSYTLNKYSAKLQLLAEKTQKLMKNYVNSQYLPLIILQFV